MLTCPEATLWCPCSAQCRSSSSICLAMERRVTLRWRAYAAAASAVLATQIPRKVLALQRARRNMAKLFMYFIGAGLILYVRHPCASLPVRLMSGSRKPKVPRVRSGRGPSHSFMAMIQWCLQPQKGGRPRIPKGLAPQGCPLSLVFVCQQSPRRVPRSMLVE